MTGEKKSGGLEYIANEFPEHKQMVTLEYVKFTFLCAINGRRDFGKIYINYVPDKKLVEVMSISAYLLGFSTYRTIQEAVVNTIGRDLVKLLAPKFLEVKGEFLSGVSEIGVGVYFVHSTSGKSGAFWWDFASQRLLSRNQEQA